MDKKHYIIIAVVSYLFFLLATAPAAPILSYLQKQMPGMQFQGISGTIWNGQAQNIRVNTYSVAQTSWSFVLWRLLTGEAGVQLDATYNGSPVNGYIGIGLTGSVIARNITTRLDARELASMISMPLGELSGKIALNLDYLNWDRTSVPKAHGLLNWNSAAITVAEQADLGDIMIELSESDASPLSADIKNKGGQLSLNGKASVSDNGEYVVELSMRPNENASRNLERSLALFAKKQSDGNYLLNNTGNLKNFGLM